MNYTIKKHPQSEIEIIITVPSDELLKFQEEALGDIAKKVHMEGFRPGKAPQNLVKEKIGEEEVIQTGIENAIRRFYPEIAKKEGLDIIGQPDAKILKEGPDLEFSIRAAVFPKIALPDYVSIAKKIAKEKKTVIIEEKEIGEAITWLRESRAAHVTVQREAKIGDTVEIDFEVTNNGVLIEGGSSRKHPLVIGKGVFVPGFEDELIGMKERDEKNFSLTMPKDYKSGLGGKKLDFKVMMLLVQERVLPELNDDFVKRLGAFESVDALNKNIREGLQKEKDEKERQRIDMLIAEEIAKNSTGEIPRVLLESELDKMFLELKNSIGEMGMELDKYLEHIKKTEEDLRKEWEKDAEKRVKIALSLRAIAEKEHIEPSEEEVETKANNSLDNFKNDGHDIKKIDRVALAEYSKNIIRNQKVFEFLERMMNS